MTDYRIFLAIHVLAAVVWAGGSVFAQIMSYRLKALNDGPAMQSFGRDMTWIGEKVFMPTSIVSLLTGLYLVEDAGWSYSDFWVAFGLLVLIAVAVAGATIVAPTGKKLVVLMAERGPTDPEVLSNVAKITLVTRLMTLGLVLVVIDMSYKPFA